MVWMREFWRADEGAVTVDWVVITAAIVGLGIAVRLTIEPAMTTQAGSLNGQLESDFMSTEFKDATTVWPD
ncbi:pilus assembly protein [Tropicimonas sp. S265A]|uniref:pilus assembly protein n=1 Tax=Tropicimonas sp. S265A TaxID=3415134 RepID=UPI003C79E8C1